jgi:hypothetical protein
VILRAATRAERIEDAVLTTAAVLWSGTVYGVIARSLWRVLFAA